jgi:hypothetical protein
MLATEVLGFGDLVLNALSLRVSTLGKLDQRRVPYHT